MDLLKPLLPLIRVWLYGQIVWAFGLLNLPAEHAVAMTDWLMGGIPLIVTVAYGIWAGWRDSKLKLIARTAALSEVAKIVTTPDLARKVDDPAVTAR